VQGCPFRCYNCFNPETWDFNGGKEWNEEIENKFMELAKRPYIKRISILGGEPLADKNLQGVLNLVNKIRLLLPQKTIWVYTGYTWEQCLEHQIRKEIVTSCDVLVDGEYIDSQRDITLKWRGSRNQRVINIQETLAKNKIILHSD
jgi:anaerobic ribonucleoside-triphosphate reductase activating protein